MAHREDADTLIPQVVGTLSDGAHNGGGLIYEGISGTLRKEPGDNQMAVAFSEVGATTKGGSGERGYPDPSDGNGHNIVGNKMQVRRLTPKECERLQGFPDNHTAIPHKGKPAADGPRYKAIGNSMAVPVMSWIGQRIQMVDDIIRTTHPEPK